MHGVNIVELPSGSSFLVDAAFGGDGPTSPLRLVSGSISQNLGAQDVRLVKGNLSGQTRREPEYWLYQYRNGPEREWNSCYCFTEMEWFHQDFEVINRFTSWEMLDRGQVLAVKFIRNGEKGEVAQYLHGLSGSSGDKDGVHVVGKLMLVDKALKLNTGGKTRVIERYETEEERLQALQRWFMISIRYESTP